MRPPEFWQIEHGRDAAPMIRALLTPLSWLYTGATARRIAQANPWPAPVPVVSVGNLSLGGTGKTPLARLLRERLGDMVNGPAAIISRGHGGHLRGPVMVDTGIHSARDVGDEPLMLAHDGRVSIARDREQAARLAVAQGARALVLDDGHQNPSVLKDLSLVVVDARAGFGNGRIVPAGPLREPVGAGLKRADAVIVMGVGGPEEGPALPGWTGPVLACSLVPERLDLKGSVLAFCGIGRPEKFEDTLRAMGMALEALVPFPDHHPYSPSELRRLAAHAEASGAALVTTEKDFMRLPEWFARSVRVVKVTARCEDPAALDRLLETAIAAARERCHGR